MDGSFLNAIKIRVKRRGPKCKENAVRRARRRRNAMRKTARAEAYAHYYSSAFFDEERILLT